MTSRRILGLLTGVLVVVTATGCVSSPTPSARDSAPPTATADPTATATPTATPEPTETATEPTPLTVPACDDLLPLEALRVTSSAAALESFGPVDDERLDRVMGPLATATLADAASSVTCDWGISGSDGSFSVTVAQIAETAGDELIAALRGAPDYDAAEPQGLTAFVRAFPEGLPTHLGYAFDGPVWVTVYGTAVSDVTSVEIAAQAAHAVTAANADG